LLLARVAFCSAEEERDVLKYTIDIKEKKRRTQVKKMELTKRTSADSAQQDNNDDSGSCSFEKRDGFSGGDVNDEEKDVGMLEKAEQEIPTTETPAKVRSHGRRSQDGRSLKTVRSHHSRAGCDGYTCFDAEATNEPGPTKTTTAGAKPRAVTEQQPYLVSWDGDADPENPRSMGKLRRWVIVLICAASSLCV
jgi:hypothetical protein